MNYKETLDYIYSFAVFGSKQGLERLEELLNKMGNPQKKLSFVHIAGTNGKGSTSTMISNVMIEAGYNTGLYISPYVLNFRERMQINGEMISEEELVDCTTYVKKHIDEMLEYSPSPTMFEVETAIAFEWYQRKGCEIVCLEVGLGGRYDATNVIDAPLVQVITKIDLDHTAILGDSLSEIAFEKAGIIKGGSTVIYPLQEEEALTTLLNQCNLKDSEAIVPDLADLEIIDNSWRVAEFKYAGLTFKKKLPALFQVYNAITAYTTIKELIKKDYQISTDNILAGIAESFFPARIEVISEKPLIIVDGAHNPSGTKALEKTLKKLDVNKINIAIGILADKNYDEMLEAILPYAENVICLTPDNPRALKADELKKYAEKYCDNTMAYDDYQEGLDYALSKTEEEDALIVCGSLYLASVLRKILIGKVKGRN